MFYGYRMNKYTSLPCTFIVKFILPLKKTGPMGLSQFFGQSDFFFFINTCLKCVLELIN